jgi:protein-tyrosine phosphatase
MTAARDWVTRKHGEEYAEQLCLTNPMAVWQGQPLPPQDEPRGLFDDEDDDETRPWWKRLFRAH